MKAPSLRDALAQCRLIAILRGVRDNEAADIGAVLYASGFRIIEVPLNSPQALRSIRALRDAMPPDCLIGAGTVIDPSACADVADAGGRLIVMPHSDGAVIRAAKDARMECAPGVATPTEAFAALAAGADALKMFPAEVLGPAAVKAWRAVLPPNVLLLPVGGIVPQCLPDFIAAGASGFGLGLPLYQPGDMQNQVAQKAQAFMDALRALR